jgi:competence protein ComEC
VPERPFAVRRTTQISLIAGSLLAGIALGRLGLPGSPDLVIGLVAITILLSRTRLLVLSLALLALSLGLWRTDAWKAGQAQLAGLIGQKVSLVGTVLDDPSRNEHNQLSFKVGDLVGEGGRRIPGEMSVYDYPVRIQRGYRVQLTGKVKAGFGNSVADMSFPQLEVVSSHQDWLEQFRQRFFVGVKTALPEPIASFGLGLLVGIRALIPKDMQTELALVGLSHLVAVSGYNLTIIVRATDRLLDRFGRGIALAASFWLIGGFLIVTGASASIVRASLVSVLSLIAAFYGRKFHPVTLILLTAAVTAIYSPKYLTDLGWLLSYLAFFGILVLAPAVEARLGHPKPVAVRLFIESFTAQVLTIPIILYFFGELSIVAPITNLLILPLVPLAMAVSFAAGLAGMIFPPFAGWIAWPATLVLTFITKIIDAFAALPWAGRTEHISFTAMIAMYALILVIILAIKRSNHRAHRSESASRHMELVAVTSK